MDLHFKNYQTMNTMAQCATNMPPPYCLRPQSAMYPRIENYEPVWEDVRNQQLLGTSAKPICSALPRDPYYRLDNRNNYDCDDIYMNDEHDAKFGCSSFSRNYFFGKRNCAWKERTRKVNGKMRYYCDDGPHCRDRDD